MYALVALALISTIEGAAESSPADRVRAYVSRPMPRSARFLDHGDLGLGLAGGTPHLYRLDLRVGLFDHVSVGVTGHWLPGQRAPVVWPVGAIALWRYLGPGQVGLEVGAHYRPVLFPPVDPEQSFVPQTHFALGTLVVSSGLFSAGLDLGAAHTRIAVVDPAAPTRFRTRTVFGGGAFARVGNRRVGLSADALAALSPDPLLVFEIALDVRFGAFSERGL
ncbi:MAG: hypothetical protein R6X02_16710 [Enhygromyxa sp.]